ncbi:hypothetical protein HJC23_004679 [Cyclotella cryptica]|uniref:Vta1/callose synthase N-terminal domain-containing protein n=1 Tax=Cyclotella cryptica TaxID=29204 RepID=A0ABD3PKF0_9STRA|eukprot:CCRYP_013878-RA/>CCRYP_013878-RA protein AED:0.25 eAED:0.25 QI:0/-1/0/1/-1/1/1/0/380
MAPLSKSVPRTLKKIAVFLRRAEELDRDKSPESRVVAYNCRQYAVLTGIPLAKSDASAKSCLGELLDQLEKEKTAMSVFSKAEHWTICRKMADRVFDKADGEDRAGLADKGTAKTFYAAGTFYEILQQFYEEEKKDGDVDDDTRTQIEEEEKKRLYCKWKATDILNAIKEGREPTPGGYQQQHEQDEDDDVPVTSPLNSTTTAHSSSKNDELPPAPEMPPPDLFMSVAEETSKHPNLQHDIGDIVPPPSYDGVELNLNGDPVEDSHEEEEAPGEIFIPGPLRNSSANNMTLDSPPPYTEQLSSTRSITSSITVPMPPTSPPKASPGVFSSFFGKSNATKFSKNQINDAVELTKFALAALQKGDGELGRQRLEQALNVLKK